MTYILYYDGEYNVGIKIKNKDYFMMNNGDILTLEECPTNYVLSSDLREILKRNPQKIQGLIKDILFVWPKRMFEDGER